MTKFWNVESKHIHTWVIDDGTSDYLVKRDPGSKPHGFPRTGTPQSDIARYYPPDARLEQSTLGLGEYHPRIHRPNGPLARITYAPEWSSSLQAVRNLLVGMERAFRVLEPSRENSDAFGHEIRQLLMLACMEVESACKAVLKANHYDGSSRKHWNTNDFVKVAEPMRLREWEVTLRYYPKFPPFKPFEGWDPTNATKSLEWYHAYNAVKHDRETNFRQSTLGSMIEAMGAAYLMVHAQFGQFGEFTPYETDAFRVTRKPTWKLSEHYVPHTLMGLEGASPKPVDYPF